jgi:hypothetical protein
MEALKIHCAGQPKVCGHLQRNFRKKDFVSDIGRLAIYCRKWDIVYHYPQLKSSE